MKSRGVNSLVCLLWVISFSMFLPASTCAGSSANAVLTITGTVNHPMQLTLGDLKKMHSTQVKFNEVKSDESFHGVFTYQGVSLQTILNMAEIEQKGSNFKKLVDATIVISDVTGKKVVLSWGEIYYRNPSEVTLAYSATPVFPVKTNCTKCHEPEEFEPAMDQLKRTVALPKLLINGDFYSDRFLEGVVKIEVVDLRPAIPVNRDAKLFSHQIKVSGSKVKPLTITSLAAYPSAVLTKKIVGVGRGYHGLHTFSGTPLSAVLSAAGLKPRMDQVVMLSAPDGYRTTFSMGELFVSTLGDKIILADIKDNSSFDRGGNIRVIVGPDNTDDRDVQAITAIEVIDL